MARTPTMSGSQDVTLAPGDVKEISLSLKSLCGNLYVSLAQGSDAQGSQTRLFVDGADKGELGSGIVKGLAVGPHQIELKGKDLYGSASVNVAADDTAQVAALVRPVGSLAIDAPADAPIALSGSGWRLEQKGGGTVANVPAGTVTLSAGGSGGWITAKATENLGRGQTLSWKPFSGGSLAFKGSDPNILAFIDGASGVQVSGTIDGISPGSRSIVLRKPGYRDKALTVTVAPGRTTEVEAGLDKLKPATLSFDDFGIGLALALPADLAKAKGSAGWEVASGIPVSLRFSSPYADRIDGPAEQITCTEGEARKLEIPNGRIVLPWLPAGAQVQIGSSKTIVLRNQGGAGFRSDPLPAGEYRLAVGTMYSGTVTVTAGGAAAAAGAAAGEAEPADYRSGMSATATAERLSYQKSLGSKRAKLTAGWISLATGLVGAAGTGVVYWLGDRAMASYRAQTSTSAAADAYKTVQLYQDLFPVTAGLGGLGLGLSPILLLGGPDPKVLQRSIEELDAGIKALGK